jgi:hypothetical protein
MSRPRFVVALVMMLAAVVGGLPSSLSAVADSGDPPPSDSEVTVPGRGDFADLKVTVSQTKNLINQTVIVSWTGAKATVDSVEFYSNFLQIMQCWGDDPTGPDRSQCQFGASGISRNNPWVVGREVNYRPSLVDPKETIPSPASGGQSYVPFWAVGEPKSTDPGTGNINGFFNSQVTNEIPLARTRGDGTGKEFFEVQTVRQAAGLGCGEPLNVGGSTRGRSCWLVIVPRGDKEVDGSIRSGRNQDTSLQSSPLSQSNWENRIVIPLQFQPVGQACPIGSPERPVVGYELMSDAFISWQSALCAGGGTLFSYTQLPDDIARNSLDGKLALVTNPVPPDQVPADHSLVYAPVGLSGLAIAFNVEHQPPGDASPADLQLNGVRFTSMKLTPRLVAKLLTQSYRTAVEIPVEDMKNNPRGLLYDAEFLQLNPEYKGFTDAGEPVPDALVQINGADVTSLLWSWVKADPDASAFLTGTPDQFGMRVNPFNQNLPLPTATFPRNDPSCSETTDDTVPGQPVTLRTCSLDSHPFANDMHDAGRSASRGDTLGRTIAAQNGIPVSKKLDRQGLGRRAVLAVVDAATAVRYGLPTAQLPNAAGKFVTPTSESLLAGQAVMKPSAVAGVLASDPIASDPVAYPLTALSYAVIDPSTLDPAARKDYVKFLRYAGGSGQQQGVNPGQLPMGMVPLPDALKAQTLAAASTIEKQTSSTPIGSSTSPTTGGTTAVPTQNSTGRSDAANTSSTATNSSGEVATNPAGAIPHGADLPAKTPNPAQQVASARRTPSLVAPAVGALFVAILICAVLAGVSPPVMNLVRTSAPARYLLSAAARRRARKEVTQTQR